LSIFPIKKYYYAPFNVSFTDETFNSGDYVMVKITKELSASKYFIIQDPYTKKDIIYSKEKLIKYKLQNYVKARVLYIFWSKDFSHIGKGI